jgi:acyl-CoA thioesterase-1
MRAAVPLLVLSTLLVSACDTAEPAPVTGHRDILAVGDSLLDFHGEKADVPEVVAESLGLTVASAAHDGSSVLGAHGEAVVDQLMDGSYSLVLASGGADDLAGCTCGVDCEPVLDALVSDDGRVGAIPDFVAQVVDSGAQVAWAGYFRPMADADRMADCAVELEELDDRMMRLDDQWPDMVYVAGSEFGRGQDADLYEEDGMHPSVEGSAMLGAVVAATVAEAFDR